MTTRAAALMREARNLGRAGPRRKPGSRALPPLFFVTDPGRIADPVAGARSLPRGAGVIYRAFGREDAVSVGLALAAVCRSRGLILLVGADEALAGRIGADGLHLPERLLVTGPRIAARRPEWLITGAAHSRRALAVAARAGLDAALVSPVFESRSPSAVRPMGTIRFTRLAREAGLPVYALGGVTARTARRLRGSGAVGVAAVDGIVGRKTA